jgi:hypothetical protein
MKSTPRANPLSTSVISLQAIDPQSLPNNPPLAGSLRIDVADFAKPARSV